MHPREIPSVHVGYTTHRHIHGRTPTGKTSGSIDRALFDLLYRRIYTHVTRAPIVRRIDYYRGGEGILMKFEGSVEKMGADVARMRC